MLGEGHWTQLAYLCVRQVSGMHLSQCQRQTQRIPAGCLCASTACHVAAALTAAAGPAPCWADYAAAAAEGFAWAASGQAQLALGRLAQPAAAAGAASGLAAAAADLRTAAPMGLLGLLQRAA